MSPNRQRSADYAMNALHRHRQFVRNWGLFVVAAALIIGALFAPNTALLAFAALLVLGVFGSGVAWVLRAFGRWFDQPTK